METADVVIVGGGIAGASLAYFLAREGLTDVVILEREAVPGYHSSGRSAAISRAWSEEPVVQAFKTLSHTFFRQPPEGFSDAPIFQPTGVLEAVSPEDTDRVDDLLAQCRAAGFDAERWGPKEACAHIPILKPEAVGAGMFVPDGGNLAIHELLYGYLRHARACGVRLHTGTTVTGVTCDAGRVQAVQTSQGTFHTRCMVNAAGAWADPLYAMAGGNPIGLIPMRRTIIVPPPPPDYVPRPMPYLSHRSYHFYFKPEGQSIIASPMDEDPAPPGDARPTDLRVAEIAELLQRWTTFSVPHLDHKWAGLRTFAPDRNPVVGEDPVVGGFFWLAGQGGSGISTSPALGRIAAELLVHGTTELFDVSILRPERFIQEGAPRRYTW